MTYRELLYKATRLIDNNKITLGEYEEMTKPLDREVEQEPILDNLRAEITTLQNRCYALTKGAVCRFCKYECEYKAESEADE